MVSRDGLAALCALLLLPGAVKLLGPSACLVMVLRAASRGVEVHVVMIAAVQVLRIVIRRVFTHLLAVVLLEH